MDPGRTVLVLADTRSRVLARLVDLWAITLLYLSVVAVPTLVNVLYVDVDGSAEVLPYLVMVMLAVVLIGWFFLRVVSVARFGRTLGQRVTGIRVVGRRDGGPVRWGQAFRRWIIPSTAPQSTLFPVVGCYFVQRADERLGQCLHDKYADTVVVQATTGKARRLVPAVLAVVTVAAVATIVVSALTA
ncbi:MAG TPA: RDD family protein [Thermomonospora sp.]|nr:RDD family protein [Thermomonospora sp.]